MSQFFSSFKKCLVCMYHISQSEIFIFVLRFNHFLPADFPVKCWGKHGPEEKTTTQDFGCLSLPTVFKIKYYVASWNLWTQWFPAFVSNRGPSYLHNYRSWENHNKNRSFHAMAIRTMGLSGEVISQVADQWFISHYNNSCIM